MKTSLLLSRAVMERVKTGLHTLQRHFADGPPNPLGQSAFLGRVLDPSHSIRFILSNLAVSSMNHKLTGSLVPDDFPGSLDSLALGWKGLSALAFLLNHPDSIRRIYEERSCH